MLSYADPQHGHVGGIYQAAGWVYVGRGGAQEAFFNGRGKRIHSRLVSKTGIKGQFGTVGPSLKSADLRRVKLPSKHKYLLPLDGEIWKRVEPLRKPYPKRARSEPADTPGDQPGKGGASTDPGASATMSTAAPTIRDRIVGFRRVRASELVMNPNNWRVHSEAQRSTLRDLLSEVGIADALVCRQLPGGKLEIIDGHLRKDTDPDLEWPVLVLDVSSEEATKLILSMDPLAAMATADLEKLGALRAMVETQSPSIMALWEQQLADAQRMAGLSNDYPVNPEDAKKLADRFLISPFTVLSARDGWWQERKRAWIALGIQSELGRGAATPPGGSLLPAMSKTHPGKIVRGD